MITVNSDGTDALFRWGVDSVM